MAAICSCSDLTNLSDRQGIINWENGETIVPAEDEHLSEEARSRYRTDAEKLSLRYVNETAPDQIEIPGELVDLFYHGLIHIVNSDHEKAVNVTQESPVHATQPASPYTIMVMVDTSAAASWLDFWRKGKTRTGNPGVDELTDRFNYTLDDYSELTSMPKSMAILRTDRLLNGYATGRLFKELNDIKGAYPIPVLYTGFIRDIEAEVFKNHLIYTFIFEGTSADFKVYKDGRVEFVD